MMTFGEWLEQLPIGNTLLYDPNVTHIDVISALDLMRAIWGLRYLEGVNAGKRAMLDELKTWANVEG